MEQTDRPKSESRQLILKTAGRLFATQGFRATTLRQISSKSGANGALVSYYFGSKGGLRDAVLTEKLQRLQQVLAPLTEGDGDLSGFQEAIRLIFRHIREDESFHRLAQRALMESEEPGKGESLWDPLFLSLSALIRKCSGNKLTKTEAAIRCLALCGTIQQYGNLVCFFKDSLPAGMPVEQTLAAYETYVAESVAANICKA